MPPPPKQTFAALATETLHTFRAPVELARELRAAAKELGLEALISDDDLAVKKAMVEARGLADGWRWEYNALRPDSGLQGRTPLEAAQTAAA